MRRIIEGHAIERFSSTKGIIGLGIKETKEIIYFNPNKCSKINGISGYVSSWFGNCLRVYAPVIIREYDNLYEIIFPLEEIEIVTEKISKKEGDEVFKSFLMEKK